MRQYGTVAVGFHAVVADRLGLGPTDHKCLDMLVMYGPMSAGTLASRTGLTTGAITGVIDRLEGHGLVTRLPDADDRRRVIVYPDNDVWQERLAPMYGRVGADSQRLLSRYSEDELRLILDFLAHACRMAESHIGELRDRQPTAVAHAPERRGRADNG